ncbi:MAG TPA: PAS domain S-box protein [Syntrophorhabdaceae bacterium]|jgi:PAS domain S-box-containing protein
MNDSSRTNSELIEEISTLRKRIRELERSGTGRAGGEEGLRLSPPQLRLLIDAGPDFFFLKDLDLRYQLVNSSIVRFFGRDEEDILGRTDGDLMPPEAAATCRESDRLAIREKRLVVTIEPVGERFYETYKSPVILAGKTVGIAGIVRDVTDRTRAESLLKESEEKYRSLTETISDVIYELDDRGTITYISPVITDIMGYEPADLVGKHFTDFVHKDDRGRLAGRFSELMKGIEYPSDYRVIDKSGHVRWVRTKTRPVMKGDRVSGARGTMMDITERKSAEEALRTSQFRLAQTMDLARIVYWEFDPVAETFIFNDPFYSFYGTTADREGGYRMTAEAYSARFVHPDDIPLFRQGRQDRLLNKAREYFYEYEHRIIRRDGVVRQILARIRASRDAAGRTLRLYGANQDITERKEAEAALRESEERFRTVFDESPVGIVMVGSDYRFIRSNAAFCAMIGYTEQELTSRAVQDIIHPEHIAEDRRNSDMLLKGEIRVYRTEKRYIRKDNEIVWGSSTVSTIHDKDRRFLYFLSMVEDITQRKQAEEQKAELESRLLQAQKMEAIGTLAGGIAHDFNNILAGIIGFTEMALDDLPPEVPSRRHLGLVLKSGLRGRDLVRQILAFSRKTGYERSPVSVSSIVNETIKLLRASLPAAVQITVDNASTSDIVFANPTEIQQIVMNLCTNAAHAMRERGGRLRITLADFEVEPDSSLGSTLAAGAYVLLAVKDTGTGIDAKVVKKIFEPFFTTKKPGQGTGMGLAVVYGIVKSLGGDISVKSSRKTGTLFHVLLPKVERGTSSGHQVEEIPRGSERILFVDDENTLAKLGKAALEKLGYRVTAMTDSIKALKIFSKNPSRFDLVITDQTMPDMQGLNLAEELLRIRPNIPIILCTGHSDAVSPEIAKKAGISGFLMKPIAKREMAEAIRRVLDPSGKSKKGDVR